MSNFKLHIQSNENQIESYKCGLKAGDRVRLKQDLIFKDHHGNPTGKIHEKGECWKVLTGMKSDPVLWFRKANGDRCTWDDDAAKVAIWFEGPLTTNDDFCGNL